MKTRAAILIELGRPLEIVELGIPPLQAGQVLAEIAYSGVCHTQLLERDGLRGPDPYLPHCLGHEASGRVLEVGSAVRKCVPGDEVILSWIKGSGANVPGVQYDWAGKPVNAGGVTTFSDLAIVSENRLTRLPPGLDLRQAALLGCAAPTGIGSVWNAAQVAEGDYVAVFGVGGVGLCAVAAAVDRGAKVMAVDVLDARLELARDFGAEAVCNVNDEDALEAVRRWRPQGVDQAIEASGRPEVMRDALRAVRVQGGQAVVIGNAPFGEMLQIDPRELNQGKRLLGVWGGDCLPDRDFPKIAERIASGRIRVEPLIGDTYALEDVNQALDDLKRGAVARPMLQMRDISCGR